MNPQAVTQAQQRTTHMRRLPNGILQRKCACGQHTVAGGECAECSKKKLTLQRRAINHAETIGVPPIVHEVLRSPGQPLDASIRAFMEPRFGHDFSRVRVHTDSGAAESARTVNALAYTVGRSVVFGAGQYSPGTAAGKRLLAHELMHVLQQAPLPEDIPEHLVISQPMDAHERNAQEIAEDVGNGGKAPSLHFRTIPVLARKPIETEEEKYKPSKMSEAYWKLSQAERAKVNKEVDRIFREETGVTRRLDWNDPKDRPLARRWLRIRDTVMEKHLIGVRTEPLPTEPTASEPAAPVAPSAPVAVPCKPTPIDITKIPGVMDAKGWTHGAALMRRWFANPPAIKPAYAAPDTTTITMDWVLGFTRAKEVYDSISKEKIYVNEPAQVEIGKLLKRLGKDKGGVFDFSLPVTLLDPTFYINHRDVTDGVSESLDDIAAALANFDLRVVVGGMVIKEFGEGGVSHRSKVTITDVGVYVADTFDFEGWQPLGCWNVCTNEVGKVSCGGGEYVSNADFRNWRTANGRGGDFLVYSDVKATRLGEPEVFYLS